MSFVDLSLPEETKRYYFKIIVVKIILSQPESFGYKFLENDYFHNPDNDEIHFTISKQRTSLINIAGVFGLTIAQFRTYNPQIISSYLQEASILSTFRLRNMLSILITIIENLRRKELVSSEMKKTFIFLNSCR